MNLTARLKLALSLLSLALAAPVFSAEKIRYPDMKLNHGHSSNYFYPLKMLELAIEKSGKQLALEPVFTDMNRKRMLIELHEGDKFDVFWGTTSIDREKTLLPVRICLMKGLMGWRIPLVATKNQEMFLNVKDLNDLKNFSAGQGIHWEDTKILRASNIPVERAYEVESLLKMLAAGRFDYFPRSVQEIWGETEVRQRQGLDIVVDTHVVIHYLNPFYLFVNPKKPELAQLLRQGLELAIKDGSFDRLFYEFYGETLVKADFENRKIIELNNPLLPPKTPVGRKKMWFSIEELKRKL